MRMDHGLKQNTTMALRVSQIRNLRRAKKTTGKSMSRMMREALDLYFSAKNLKEPEAPDIFHVLDDLGAVVRSLRALHHITSDHMREKDHG
jgi:hypothetical protein